MKATRLPRGIESPQSAVAPVLSLSGNQSLQNWVIILKNRGQAMLIHTSPARIGQNETVEIQKSLNQAPVNIIKIEMRVTLWGFITLYR